MSSCVLFLLLQLPSDDFILLISRISLRSFLVSYSYVQGSLSKIDIDGESAAGFGFSASGEITSILQLLEATLRLHQTMSSISLALWMRLKLALSVSEQPSMCLFLLQRISSLRFSK
jgi:hypothetical protein